MALGERPSIPALPGVDDDLGSPRQGVGEGVLARAGADDADLGSRAAKRTYCSRPGPTPTKVTGTPACSAMHST